MTQSITQQSLARKRREVNQAYRDFGFKSPEYEKSFDELHVMNMKFMAERFRREKGLLPGAKTPYCEKTTH